MEKVKIIKEIDTVTEMGNFTIYLNGKVAYCRSFKVNEPKESVYNEERNFDESMSIAKMLENGDTKIAETVYTTPENKN